MTVTFEVDGAPPVILASASTTRLRLLRNAGVAVEAITAAVDEAALKDSLRAEEASAAEAAVALAALKAQRVAERAPHAAIVLGADQILTCDGRWFDKPVDGAAARRQLRALAGRRHELPTAVVAFRGGARVWHHLATPKVSLRPCTDAFIDTYLALVGDLVTTTVGGYHAEGLGAQLFARIEGDQYAILGLPLLEVLAFLRDQGVLRA